MSGMSYTEPRHPMKVVVRRTGLTAHVLRVWERRYEAVVPTRTGTNRRLYSDADIDRLRLLRLATTEGHAIGSIAKLDEDELKDLVSDKSSLAPAQSSDGRETLMRPIADEEEQALLERCKKAAQTFDTTELESALLDAKRALSVPVLLEELVAPLLVWVGDSWRDGSARIAHEHLVSATIRKFLTEMRPMGSSFDANSPSIVVATPPGHLHETGAMMAAIVAASEGWRDIYLGPNIPIEEIANAARTTNARAVALSIVYPSDTTVLTDELRALRRHLGDTTALFVGGSGSKAYRGVLEELDAVWSPDLHSFRRALESLRQVDDIRNVARDQD